MENMKSATKTVFVYGSLKRDKPLNQSWMVGSEFVADDSVEGELYLLSWYPALLLEEGGRQVPGEVWEMPERSFERVRMMEESAGYRTVKTITAAGREVYAFEYIDRTVRDRYQRIEKF